MPNWCHNTLTVTGNDQELARFVEAARPTEDAIRSWWKEAKATKYGPPEKRTFKKFLADKREAQPLSFDSLVPQPTKEEYAAMDAEVSEPCDMCGGIGTLPESPEQALAQGAKWYDWMNPAERKDRSCNVCGGSGWRVPIGKETWWTWRHENWGCKWDASFDGPFMALGAEGADVDATVAAQGGVLTPTVAVYKFDTPWSPPVPFVERASALFPELEFTIRFGEPGEGYAGEVVCMAGVTISDQALEVEDVLMPEEMWF